MPWIEGENPTAETFDPEEWAVSLAAFVRSCRAVPGMDGPVRTEGRGGAVGGARRLGARVGTAQADPALVSYDAVLAVWEDALAAPAYDGEPCWFHGDLHEGNLLVRDGRLAAVIDWGAAGRGDPAIELNAMWGYLPPRSRTSTARRSASTRRRTAGRAASRWRPPSAADLLPRHRARGSPQGSLD